MQKLNAAVMVLAGSLVSLPLCAADTYTIDSNHTHPSYEINHLGFSIQRGRFDKVTGKITLDRAAKTGSMDVIIDMASVSTGVPKLDDHLKSEDFFNVAKYPTMTFKASKITFNGDTPATVPGELTIMGVTKPVTLTITHFVCGAHPMNKKDMCGAEAWASIKRSEFGITKFLPVNGDDAKLLINVEALKD